MVQIQGERMNTIKTKYMVVSLPRTGTKSILKMFSILGYEIKHAPSNGFYQGYLNRIDVMGDTPCFRPSIIEQMIDEAPDMKFIYVNKMPEAWVDSVIKVNLSINYNRMYTKFVDAPESLVNHEKVDFESLYEILGGPFYKEIAIEGFIKHKNKIKDIIPVDRLLEYDFSQGWEPLCDFLGESIPDAAMPHLNKNTMFDKITD